MSIAVFVTITGFASADTFGTGANQFEIDFVPIAGDNGDLGSWSAGGGYTFSGVNHGDYRIGTYEITNDQWNKFKNEYGTVTGSPLGSYHQNPYWTGTNVPTNNVSWVEAAQFVNWLNTSHGHQAAYKFTGTQGTSDYSLGVWDASSAWGGTNLYRHKDAYYFLPTEEEWVKAAYWNGTNLQTYATVGNVTPTQDGWNFYDNGYATDPYGPWDVGDGTEEINGTYDMMGNVWEWMESPDNNENYLTDSGRCLRGGSFYYSNNDYYLRSSFRTEASSSGQSWATGFRVASVPEPCSLVLLGLGGLLIRKRR